MLGGQLLECKTQEGELIPAGAGTQCGNTSHLSTIQVGCRGSHRRILRQLVTSKLITTSCLTTELLFPLHDNSFRMSMSVCVCFKLMHESKTRKINVLSRRQRPPPEAIPPDCYRQRVLPFSVPPDSFRQHGRCRISPPRPISVPLTISARRWRSAV